MTIHLQTGSSTVKCGLVMRSSNIPDTAHGWDLGNVTTEAYQVTCPTCLGQNTWTCPDCGEELRMYDAPGDDKAIRKHWDHCEPHQERLSREDGNNWPYGSAGD